MNEENRLLLINEQVEFEKQAVEVQDYRKITDPFRGIFRIYHKLIQKNRKTTTCNRLDMETLGF